MGIESHDRLSQSDHRSGQSCVQKSACKIEVVDPRKIDDKKTSIPQDEVGLACFVGKGT